MKQCINCYHNNQDIMNFCSQCGSVLTNSSFNAGNNFQSAQATMAFPTETPTVFRARQTQGFNSFQNNFTPNFQTPVRKSNHKKVMTIFGSILVLFLLFGAVGAATAYRVYISSKKKSEPVQITVVKDNEPTNTNPANTNPTNTNPVKENETVKSDPVKKTETKKTTTKTNTSKKNEPGAKFENTWVDYNVTENGRLGMRIHVKFEVNNMKSVDSYLAVYFEKSDGTQLKTTNKKFASKDGQVAIYQLLKPSYDKTVYEDLTLFMPYDELNLGRGKHNLKMDIDVIYEDGGMIGHLDYYEFWYERKNK